MLKRILPLITLIIIAAAIWYARHLSAAEPSETYAGGTYAPRDGTIPDEGQTVLFFSADWCPSCQRVEQTLQESGIPDGWHIRVVDYDTADKLKQQYTVTTQTTFVAIDQDGEMITRWIGARGMQDIIDQVATADVEQPRETVAREGSDERREAVFAGGCFWCMEGPFEAMEGVESAIAGYAGGSADDADYQRVASGGTQHREAVQVIYDPALVSYDDLLETYRRQIDPTDDSGQFADRGYQYTTAIYYSTESEQQAAERSRDELEESGRFDLPIVTEILPFATFFPAEDYHQDYYLKQSGHYQRYKKGSGRAGFIDENRDDQDDLSHLTELQRRVTQEGYTERPFDNEYWDEKRDGIYVDIVDGTPLFSSTDKFDSGTGRPSFTKPIHMSEVETGIDTSYDMRRVEIESDSSDSHLGHVFNDGPGGTQRYCINSAALRFIPREEMELKGYGEYLELFE